MSSDVADEVVFGDPLWVLGGDVMLALAFVIPMLSLTFSLLETYVKAELQASARLLAAR